jgi:hypothetical protein
VSLPRPFEERLAFMFPPAPSSRANQPRTQARASPTPLAQAVSLDQPNAGRRAHPPLPRDDVPHQQVDCQGQAGLEMENDCEGSGRDSKTRPPIRR